MKQTDVARDNLRFATIETYVAWLLSEGQVFVTDHSNAAVTGLVDLSATAWDPAVTELLEIPTSMLPRIVATMGEVGHASALPGSPVIAALIGDQPASLFGQSCLSPGQAKITFGTGAMLDVITGETGPDRMTRFSSGCFPIVASSAAGTLTWGAEAIMLSAGTCIEWLREDLGLISSAAETETLARAVEGTDGVSFVPALMGLGTPQWDFGARGAFFGLTRGSTKAHLVRAVLDGIAQRAVDLVEAAVSQVNNPLDVIRVDGGMTQNSYLMQRLADFSGRTIEISKELEATTKGAGLMALIAIGALRHEDVATMWEPRTVHRPLTTPEERQALRSQWADVVSRAEKSIPELSSVNF
jgi:glycerol kinase